MKIPEPVSSHAPGGPGSSTVATARLGRESLILSVGFATAQLCSFLRNAIMGYALSKGDFGIAATITLVLQMLETLSDLGADRLLVQATDGDDVRLMAAAHTTLVIRGLLTAGLIYVSAGVAAGFFDIPKARGAFEAAALVPMIKAFMHLDSRRQQRSLQNRNFVLIEVVPQLLSLAATMPALALIGGYQTVVWIAVLQALLSVATSHVVSGRRYLVGFQPEYMNRLIAFGWPIWLSAFPLIMVYQGDRIIIGRMLGMDSLAGYSAAFMVAMVPGLLAAKVGHALMLPLLSAQRGNPQSFQNRYVMMCEGASIAASIYLVAFVLAGGLLLPLTFGSQYLGLGIVIGWLAAMWSLRMVQAVPGMALLAIGDTRPLLTAGILRASALCFAWVAVELDCGLAGVAAAGVAGELASLLYVAIRAGRNAPGIARTTIECGLFPLMMGAAAAGIAALLPIDATAWLVLSFTTVGGVACLLAGLALMPAIRDFIRAWKAGKDGQTVALTEDKYAANRA